MSDDDCPPPLEDMTAHVEKIRKQRVNQQAKIIEEQVEEVRLGGGKKPEYVQQEGVTRIMPSDSKEPALKT